MASDGSPGESAPGEYEKARPSKFRFKTKREREENEEARSSKRHKESSSHESSRRSHHKKRRKDDDKDSSHKKRKKQYYEPLDDNPSLYDDTFSGQSHIDPEKAFRESLFDALADDEGAAYWEGVYGQPIHTYSNAKPGPGGELEQMTEAEYAEHVRSKMWEKTHEHLVEERRKREEGKKRQKEERKKNTWRQDDDCDLFEEKIAASLRRGQERRSHKRWEQAWKRYVEGWQNFAKTIANKSDQEGSLAGKTRNDIIPWPVETGRWKDADKEDVENFFRSAPPEDSKLAAILKVERVRWHPDKMQQRFGQNKLDEDTIKTITAVFQVVDRLYTENRSRR